MPCRCALVARNHELAHLGAQLRVAWSEFRPPAPRPAGALSLRLCRVDGWPLRTSRSLRPRASGGFAAPAGTAGGRLGGRRSAAAVVAFAGDAAGADAVICAFAAAARDRNASEIRIEKAIAPKPPG